MLKEQAEILKALEPQNSGKQQQNNAHNKLFSMSFWKKYDIQHMSMTASQSWNEEFNLQKGLCSAVIKDKGFNLNMHQSVIKRKHCNKKNSSWS